MSKLIDAKIRRLVQNDAFNRLSTRRRSTTNLYIMEEIQDAKTVIKAGHQDIICDQPTICVFVDEEPMANWSHDCSYLLYSADEGKLYQEVKACFPPFLVEPPDTFKAFHLPVVLQNPLKKVWRLERDVVFPWRMRKGERYAILFSGASNNRHTNDLEFLYRQLVDKFYFDENKITVLNYDGSINYSGGPKPVTAWPGDGTAYIMPVHDQGTKQAFEDALDALKTQLKSEDLLLIHTNNHGGHNGTESYLCTYSGPSYSASEFASKLGELPVYADLVVMMEQCHSGGFNDLVIEASTARRTTFAAACTEGKNSIGGAEFDPFACDWISALAGCDPYGAPLAYDPDYNSSGRVSARETFIYADDLHNSYDSPVYSAYGSDAGDQHLHQQWRYLFMHKYLIVEQLTQLRAKLANPRLYRKAMKENVLPALMLLDDQLAVKPSEPDKVRKVISEIIRSAQDEYIKGEYLESVAY